MKRYFFLSILVPSACNQPHDKSKKPQAEEIFHTTTLPSDSLEKGVSYLSVFSEIYSNDEYRTHSLITTVSLRNTSASDTLYVSEANYYNTGGNLLKNYFKETIYLAPLETGHIVIPEADKDGGSGANFLFKWHIRPGAPEPLFEAVMISTYGQQGLSFITTGKRLE